MAPVTFFATRRKLSGREWETVCVSGVTQNDGHKPKQERNHIMKTENILTYIVAALSILVTSASSSPAAPAQTLPWHAYWRHASTVTAIPVPVFTVTGNWNVNIDPATPAQVTLNVFYDGSHHFGVRAQRVDAGLVRPAASTCSRDSETSATRDARYECNSGDVLLARRTPAAAARPSIPTTR